jgi:hypothetical protein
MDGSENLVVRASDKGPLTQYAFNCLGLKIRFTVNSIDTNYLYTVFFDKPPSKQKYELLKAFLAGRNSF